MSVVIYSTPYCPFCIRAKQLLDSKGVQYKDFDVAAKPKLRKEMELNSGERTVPQIWINKKHVGGCDQLFELERRKQLDSLLLG